MRPHRRAILNVEQMEQLILLANYRWFGIDSIPGSMWTQPGNWRIQDGDNWIDTMAVPTKDDSALFAGPMSERPVFGCYVDTTRVDITSLTVEASFKQGEDERAIGLHHPSGGGTQLVVKTTLTMNGAAISGLGNLHVGYDDQGAATAATFNWTGGRISGSGQTLPLVDVSPLSTLAYSGSAEKILSHRQLTAKKVTWTAAGTISLQDEAHFRTFGAGATFTVNAPEVEALIEGGSPEIFELHGTTTVNVDFLRINAYLINYSTMNVEKGWVMAQKVTNSAKIDLVQAGRSHLSLGANADEVHLKSFVSGGTTYRSEIIGAGSTRFAPGSKIEVTGGAVHVDGVETGISPSVKELDDYSSEIKGSGDLLLLGNVNWYGSKWLGEGAVQLGKKDTTNLTMTIHDKPQEGGVEGDLVMGRWFNSYGKVIWQRKTHILQTKKYINKAEGTFEIMTNKWLKDEGVPSAEFVNEGRVVKEHNSQAFPAGTTVFSIGTNFDKNVRTTLKFENKIVTTKTLSIGDGIVEVFVGAQLEALGGLDFAGDSFLLTGTVRAAGFAMFAGTLDAYGSATTPTIECIPDAQQNGTAFEVIGGIASLNAGTLTANELVVEATGVLELIGNNTLTALTVAVGDGGVLRIQNGATFYANSFTNAGDIELGRGTIAGGILMYDRNGYSTATFSQGGNGSLLVLAMSSGHGALTVNGAANVAGAAEIRAVGGYQPTPGTEIWVISATSLSESATWTLPPKPTNPPMMHHFAWTRFFVTSGGKQHVYWKLELLPGPG